MIFPLGSDSLLLAERSWVKGKAERGDDIGTRSMSTPASDTDCKDARVERFHSVEVSLKR